jgi:hypothetical protein
MQLQILDKVWRRTALTCTAVLALSTLGIAQAYQQTNLVSDIQGLAQNPPSGQPDAQLGVLFQVPQVRGGYPTTMPAFRPSTTDRD